MDGAHEDTTIKVLRFVYEFRALNPFGPSLEEMAVACTLSHRSGVSRHLDKLEAWGCITRVKGRARSVAITRRGEQLLRGIPLEHLACPGDD